jgi:hypothetical protein
LYILFSARKSLKLKRKGLQEQEKWERRKKAEKELKEIMSKETKKEKGEIIIRKRYASTLNN